MKRTTALRRFWASVRKTPTCWIWMGSRNRAGYGTVGNTQAHRRAYELLVGPIPAGLSLDHLCFNRVCVNPKHLEPVTHRENMRRAALARIVKRMDLYVPTVAEILAERSEQDQEQVTTADVYGGPLVDRRTPERTP